MKLPSGPGAPAPDARDVARRRRPAACRGMSHASPRKSRVSGSVGGAASAGVCSPASRRPASARLEAVAPFGQPVFILVARPATTRRCCCRATTACSSTAGPATCSKRWPACRSTPPICDRVLTGCAPAPATDARTRARRRLARRRCRSRRRRLPAPRDERTVAARGGDRRGRTRRPAWRAEYGDFQDGLPRAHPARSSAPAADAFDLRLALSQVELNVPLGAEAFRVQIPRPPRRSRSTNCSRSGPLGANGR